MLIGNRWQNGWVERQARCTTDALHFVQNNKMGKMELWVTPSVLGLIRERTFLCSKGLRVSYDPTDFALQMWSYSKAFWNYGRESLLVMMVSDFEPLVIATYSSFGLSESASRIIAWSYSSPLTSKVVAINLLCRRGLPECRNSL